ncbi:MAG: Gfo/Idh/MocA family oxidoreductase [Phycisphaeraceae bacterium]
MNQLRIGFLGCGRIQRKHLSGLLRRDDAVAVAFADPNAANIDVLLESEKVTPSGVARYASMDELYAHGGIDAVVIATPHTMHDEHIAKALEADLHIMVEKPMVTTVAGARRMIELAEASKKHVLVAYNSPYSPEFRYLREVIREERFGRLQMVSGYISQGWRPFVKGTWREDVSLSGGGFAYDSGAHPLNSVCWAIDRLPTRVLAWLDELGGPVEINASILARFGEDVTANITLAGDSASGFGSFMVFCFERGRIEIDGWNGNWIRVWDGPAEVKYPAVAGGALQPIDHLIEVIRGEAEPLTSPRNGLVHSMLMEMIYASAESGLAVEADQAEGLEPT